MIDDSADRAVMAELQMELVALREKFDRSQEEVDRLRGLWPRAELQRLHLDLAQKSAALTQTSAQYEGLLNSTLARLPRPVWALVGRLHGLARVVRLAKRVGRLALHLPGHMAFRRQRRADRAVIAASPIFDATWYRAQAMGGDTVSDAAGHYVWLGHAAGHDPHPLFDGAWYAAGHQALGLANPFADYVRRGMAAGEDPHPLFDASYYVAQVPEAAGRALAHYAARRHTDGPQPVRLFDPIAYPQGLAHWARVGAAQDRDPHPLFATAWYRRTWLGGARGKNPLAHWVREGAAAGLPPNPFGLDPDRPPVLPNPAGAPLASIIVNRTAGELDGARCLMAVAQHSSSQVCEVILAGPGPAIAWLDGLRTAPDLATGAAMARAPYLVLLDGATVVHDGWLAALLDTAAAGAGLVGVKVLGADGMVRSAGFSVAEDGRLQPESAGQNPADPGLAFARPAASVDPACLLVQRDVWDRAGGLGEAANDVLAVAGLAMFVRGAGLPVIVQPACTVMALGQLNEPEAADQDRFWARWAAALTVLHDPTPVVLVLTSDIPARDETAAARALHLLLGQGRQVTLAPEAAASPQAASYWERRGVEILRGPSRLSEWLTRSGGRVAETWSFRNPADVPAAALLLHTGGAILQWQPGLPHPAWCDAELALERAA